MRAGTNKNVEEFIIISFSRSKDGLRLEILLSDEVMWLCKLICSEQARRKDLSADLQYILYCVCGVCVAVMYSMIVECFTF